LLASKLEWFESLTSGVTKAELQSVKEEMENALASVSAKLEQGEFTVDCTCCYIYTEKNIKSRSKKKLKQTKPFNGIGGVLISHTRPWNS